MRVNHRKIEIVLGSESDLNQTLGGLEVLKNSGVPYRVHIISCHRNPEDLRLYARDEVTEEMILIAAGSKAFALPGVLQSWLQYFGKKLVCIGVALEGKTPKASVAARLSIEELPGNPLLLQNGSAYFGFEGFAAACRDALTKDFAIPLCSQPKPARLSVITKL